MPAFLCAFFAHHCANLRAIYRVPPVIFFHFFLAYVDFLLYLCSMIHYKKNMNIYLKRIIKTVVFTTIIAAVLGYEYKVRHELPSWEQVLTTRFWVLSTIHLIPAYFVVWSLEDTNETWSAGRVTLIIIMVVWFIILGIINYICRTFWGIELL